MLQQLAEIRDYYLAQMHKVREHFDQQRKLIAEFSVNRMSSEQPSSADHQPPPPPNDIIVRMENGTASTMAAAAADEDDLYRYNESMKSEIRRLTSLRNLHEAFATESETKFGAAAAPPAATSSSCNGGSSNAGSCTNKEAPAASGAASSSSRYDLYADNVSNGGKLMRPSEDEGDEKTSMLPNAKISRWKKKWKLKRKKVSEYT